MYKSFEEEGINDDREAMFWADVVATSYCNEFSVPIIVIVDQPKSSAMF